MIRDLGGIAAYFEPVKLLELSCLSKIPSAQNCYLCLRYDLSPMSPGWTHEILVGERGFEPPTPWSRTRFEVLLKLVEICGSQLVAVEPVAGWSVKAVEFW